MSPTNEQLLARARQRSLAHSETVAEAGRELDDHVVKSRSAILRSLELLNRRFNRGFG